MLTVISFLPAYLHGLSMKQFVFYFHFLVFSIRFICTGKTTGQVDMTLNLNYTKVTAASVDVEDFKSFSITARRKCLKTGISFYFSSTQEKSIKSTYFQGMLLASQLVIQLFCNYLGHTV